MREAFGFNGLGCPQKGDAAARQNSLFESRAGRMQRVFERARVRFRSAQPQQRVAGTEPIVQRCAVVEPDMR